MRTFSGKRSTLALAIAGVTAMSGFMAIPGGSAPKVHRRFNLNRRYLLLAA